MVTEERKSTNEDKRKRGTETEKRDTETQTQRDRVGPLEFPFRCNIAPSD